MRRVARVGRVGVEKARQRFAVSSGYLRVDLSGAVEILVEQAMPTVEIDAEAAKKDLAAAEAELAKRA